MQSRLSSIFVLLVLSSVTLAGCGRGAEADPRVPVSGSVSLDGKPLPSGTITFLPLDGKGASGGGVIAEGKYEALVAPGRKRVMVFSERVVGRQPRDPGDPNGEKVDVAEQIIPERYNRNSQLRAEVGPAGGENVDFTLKTSG